MFGRRLSTARVFKLTYMWCIVVTTLMWPACSDPFATSHPGVVMGLEAVFATHGLRLGVAEFDLLHCVGSQTSWR